jgi:toxin ParE1/3/4
LVPPCEIEAIANCIDQDSPAYSKSVVRNILSRVKATASCPLSGRKVPELDEEEFREVFAYSYRIIYQVQINQITIVAVIHGRRFF